MTLSANDIETLKNFFSGKPVKRAFVFGSYSRNEATADSDVDILVELDYSQHIGFAFFSMQQELENQIGKKVDLVSYGSLSKRILPFIEKDKLLIYER